MRGSNKSNKSKYFLIGTFLAGYTVVFLPSCTHDSMVVIDPDPIDTNGNPSDTTGNPIDTTAGTPCDTNLVYFSTDILPLLKSNCAKSGCHDAITHEEGIVLDNYQNVMGSEVIKPYDIHDSDLYEAVSENDFDDRMPPSPNTGLSGDQISLIAKWIMQGAKDITCNASAGQCVTANVTYSGFVAPLLATYCVGCHSGGAPSGGITLNTYAGVKAVSTTGRLYGAITWAAGFQQMPRGSNQLSQCHIDKIKGWIDDGSPNN